MRFDSPFLIVGAGAIGSIVGTHLARAGYRVAYVEANAAHVDAVRQRGLRLEGALEAVTFPDIYTPDAIGIAPKHVLLAVKASATERAVAAVAASLDPQGFIVSLQNGLEELKIARAVGAERTIGAYITFGGHYAGPGRVVYGGKGSFKLGELDGGMTERLAALREAFASQQEVETTANIFGWLWAKIALGAVYFATATADADVVDLYEDAELRVALGRLAGEAVRVAEAAGVAVETCDGFDPKAFRSEPWPADRVAASWEAQRAYWRAHTGITRTGVWRDLAVHRRRSEVDEQIGAIIRVAREHAVPVPRIERLKAVVEEIERGQRGFSAANILEAGA
jgi:2-dehydropantoate 2-reductase